MGSSDDVSDSGRLNNRADLKECCETRIRDGWVMKWTNYLRSWKRRYLVLDNKGKLSYAPSKNGPFKEMSLKGSKINLHSGDSLRMDITTSDNITLFFKTETAVEKSTWYALIKQSQYNNMTDLGTSALASNSVIFDNDTFNSQIPTSIGKLTVPTAILDSQINKQDGTQEAFHLHTPNNTIYESKNSSEQEEISISDITSPPYASEATHLKTLQSNFDTITYDHNPSPQDNIDNQINSTFPSLSHNDPLGTDSEQFSPDNSLQKISSNDTKLDLVDIDIQAPTGDSSSNSIEKNSLKNIRESSVAFQQHSDAAFKNIKVLQNLLLEDLGKLKNPNGSLPPSSRENFLKLIQNIDLVQNLTNCFLASSKSFLDQAKSDREQIEKSLKLLSKQCSAYEKILGISREAVSQDFPSGLTLLDSDSENFCVSSSDLSEFFDCDDGQIINPLNKEPPLASLEPILSSISEKEKIDSFDEAFSIEEYLLDENAVITSLQDYQLMTPGYRVTLPAKYNRSKTSPLSFLRDFIGKDLTRISMPVSWNEPTSFLQRLAEDFQYDYLLKKAAKASDSTYQLALLSAFVASPYASSKGRILKPFNPILGETYEHSHRGFRLLCEQVSHHPPITAYHAENEFYTAWGDMSFQMGLSKVSMKVSLAGAVNLVLHSKKGPQHFHYSRPELLIHNIFLGNLWNELDGTICVRNSSKNEFALLQFIPKGWLGNKLFRFRGLVFDDQLTPHYYIFGNYNSEIYISRIPSFLSDTIVSVGNPPKPNDYSIATDKPYPFEKVNSDHLISFSKKINWSQLESATLEEKVLVWKEAARPPNSEQYYGFGYFTMELNELTEDYMKGSAILLPPTDSRFRPDQRYYENGDLEMAKQEKSRLEDKQRSSARSRAYNNREYSPRWFEIKIDPVTNLNSWTFKGGYWEAKKNQSFTDCEDIF